MPMLDMPLKELEKYTGISVKPADFDEFWDRGIEELKNVDRNPEFIPSDFKTPFADCFDLYFTGVKGARIHAKVLMPKDRSKRCPAVLQFHGYTGSCGNWNDKLNYAAAGFVIAALDCRGQAGQSEDVGGVKGNTMHGQIIRGLEGDPDNMLMRNIFLDTVALAWTIMELPYVDETKVGVMGGSQGGGLSIACASLEPRIARAAVQFPFLSDYRRVWEMDLAKNAYEEISMYFRFFDPLHEREDAIFERLGYLDVHNLAPRIRGKVQMAITLLDNICPPSTQFAVYNNIQSEKEHYIYPDFGHEYLPGNDDLVYQFLLGLVD